MESFFLIRPYKINLLILASLSFCFCSGPNQRSGNKTGDTVFIDEIHRSEVKITLQPLEPGEIRVTDEAFGPVINLKGEPLHTKEITRATQMFVKDNYLITNNSRSDSIFMVFELPDMKCVTAFGKKGRGPDEFGFPNIVNTYEDSILFYVYEQSNDKVYKVSRERMAPEYYLTLPRQERLADKQIYFLDHRSALYVASAERGKMIYYFNNDSVPKEKEISDLSIPGLKGSWTTYIGDFGINTVHSRLAFAYKYFKRLRIIDPATMVKRDIIFDTRNLAKGQNDIQTLEPTNITHFWGMSPGENHFWMLYSGRTPIDVQTANRSNNKYIYVEKYDWNGNPVSKYRLDDWGYFCVDEKNETLYLSSTASVFSILKYDISDQSTGDGSVSE